jgi:hypothetical protein
MIDIPGLFALSLFNTSSLTSAAVTSNVSSEFKSMAIGAPTRPAPSTMTFILTSYACLVQIEWNELEERNESRSQTGETIQEIDQEGKAYFIIDVFYRHTMYHVKSRKDSVCGYNDDLSITN